MSDTGGWELTESYAPTGSMCLSAPDGAINVVYNEHSLTPSQLRALGAACVEAAERLEAQRDD